MPTFEFYCNTCQTVFEELILKRDEFGSIKCPKCRQKNWERLYSTFAVRSGSDNSSNIGSSCTSCTKSSCVGCTK